MEGRELETLLLGDTYLFVWTLEAGILLSGYQNFHVETYAEMTSRDKKTGTKQHCILTSVKSFGTRR